MSGDASQAGALMHGCRHRHRRAVLGALVAAGSAVTLAACGSSSHKAASAGAASTGSPSANSSAGGSHSAKIGFVELFTSNPFYQELAQGAKAAAAAIPGATVSVTGPPAPNPTTEVTDLQQVTSQNVDGVVLDPSPADLFTKAIGDAAQQTRLVSVDNPPTQGISGNDTFVSYNEAQTSDAMMKVVVQHLGANPSGTVVLGDCLPGNSSLAARTESYESYLKAHAPGLKVVTFTSTTDPQQSLTNWNNAYADHSTAVAFIGNCDVDGPSLARMHTLHPGKYVTATYDVDTATLQGIKAGTVTVAVNELPYVRGYIATGLLIDAAKASKPVVKGFVNVKGQIVTESNVSKVIAAQADPNKGYGPESKAYLKDPTTTTGPIVLQPLADAYSK